MSSDVDNLSAEGQLGAAVDLRSVGPPSPGGES